MIIITPGKFVEGEMPDTSVGMEGWFTLRAIRRSGRVTRERKFRVLDPFHNLITNYGMDSLGNRGSNQLFLRCHVGTGTTAPLITDVALANFHAAVSSSNPSSTFGNSGTAPYYGWRAHVWTSAIGALGNVILTEVGISHTTTTGNLLSRELIRDGGGSPTSFPLNDDEQLEVTYEFRTYVPMTDAEATVMVGSTSHDTITRALSATNATLWSIGATSSGSTNFDISGNFDNTAYSGDLVDMESGSISGSLGNQTGSTTAAYTPGNHYLDASSTWGTGSGNGAIRTVKHARSCCRFQIQYDPPINKTNTQTLILNQRVSWARR